MRSRPPTEDAPRATSMTKEIMPTPIPADEKPVLNDIPGAVLLSESIVAILPGADLVPEIHIDRAAQFETVRRALDEFRLLGGAAIVDLGGLTTGRDAEQLELLEQTTGVRIVASTGLGPLWTVGSHFTNNVSTTGMTAERIADIFVGELSDGLLVPPRTRVKTKAGVISVTTVSGGDFETRILRASAQAAIACGSPLFLRAGDDPLASIATLEAEEVSPDRVLIAALDRKDHVEAGLPAALAARGYSIALDHVGWPETSGFGNSSDRIRLVLELFEAGFGERVVVSSSAIGAALELPAPVHGDFSRVLRDFVPAFRSAGGTDEQVAAMIDKTPRRLLGSALDGQEN
jgi:phosphotriesterase-related protein